MSVKNVVLKRLGHHESEYDRAEGDVENGDYDESHRLASVNHVVVDVRYESAARVRLDAPIKSQKKQTQAFVNLI